MIAIDVYILDGEPPRKRKKSRKQRINRKIKALDKVCRYCLVRPAQTVDHIIPKSRGGTNRQINLVGCCYGCNQKKADSTPKEAGLVLHLPLRFFNLYP